MKRLRKIISVFSSRYQDNNLQANAKVSFFFLQLQIAIVQKHEINQEDISKLRQPALGLGC